MLPLKASKTGVICLTMLRLTCMKAGQAWDVGMALEWSEGCPVQIGLRNRFWTIDTLLGWPAFTIQRCKLTRAAWSAWTLS